MRSALLKTILIQNRIAFTKAYRMYISNKFDKADICAVWRVDKNSIAFETSSARGVAQTCDDIHKVIRKSVGQSILTVFGLPTDEKIPMVFLLPFPSLFFTLGFKKAYQFIKEWKGDSSVGEIIVVEYKNLPIK